MEKVVITRTLGTQLKFIEDNKIETKFLPMTTNEPKKVPYDERLVTIEFGILEANNYGYSVFTNYDGRAYYYGEIKENPNNIYENMNKLAGMDVSNVMLPAVDDRYYIEHPLGNYLLDHSPEWYIKLEPLKKIDGRSR